jgi:hypothetical protein
MKTLLLILFVSLFVSCSNNKREAIQTICKGVESTGETCRSAVGLTGKCAECAPTKENAVQENVIPIDISTLELQKNSMIW